MFDYKILDACRLCGSKKIKTVLDLGEQYVVTFIPNSEVQAWKDGNVEKAIPLSMVVCEDCTFVQLGQSVNPDRLYRKFWYKSGINESMRSTLHEIVNEACDKVGSWDHMSVLDIGSNDGTLLSFYKGSVAKVGFDPAENLAEEAKRTADTDHIFADYFCDKYLADLELIASSKGDGLGVYRVITAISMFYDLEDPFSFLQLIKKVLHPRGVFVIQMNYLMSMLKLRAIDNIAHEHLAYYSLSVLNRLVSACGLELLDAQTNDVNGGSIKVTIGHAGGLEIPKEASERINKLLIEEENEKLHEVETYKQFGLTMRNIISKINWYLQNNVGRDIYLYGASTRGSTLMQCLDKDIASKIKGAAERNPEKYGHSMVGTWIPIISEEEARKDADVFLVLPWHFKQAILDREESMLRLGIDFLFPLPVPRIYSVEML